MKLLHIPIVVEWREAAEKIHQPMGKRTSMYWLWKTGCFILSALFSVGCIYRNNKMIIKISKTTQESDWSTTNMFLSLRSWFKSGWWSSPIHFRLVQIIINQKIEHCSCQCYLDNLDMVIQVRVWRSRYGASGMVIFFGFSRWGDFSSKMWWCLIGKNGDLQVLWILFVELGTPKSWW